jgi:hypothetical protein
MSTEQVIIAERFNGPPGSGNGGYCCGLLAERLGGAVEVTLRSPPPLGKPLNLTVEERAVLRDGDVIVAEARRASLELELPPAVGVDRASEASAHYSGFEKHAFPTCFTCGPQRSEGDGLRVFAGKVDGQDLVAAPWTPHASLVAEGERLAPRIAWAVLDCPGYFAVARPGEMAVLGRMHALVEQELVVNRPCVVVGWSIGREGRKLYAGTALYSAAGEPLAYAHQTWIQLRQA